MDGPRSETFRVNQETFIRLLLGLGAVGFGVPTRFKLHTVYPEAPQISAYVNNRKLLGNVRARRIGISLLDELSLDFSFTHIAGIPTGATPYGAWLADRRNVGFIDLNKELLDGTGKHVLLVEDTVSLATSTVPLIKQLRAANYDITNVVAFYSWEIGGRRILQETGVQLHTAVMPEELLNVAQENEFVLPELSMQIIDQRNRLQDYLERRLR